jgi:hypothetical protein
MIAKTVTFSDRRDSLRWVSALPIHRGGVHYEGDRLDLIEQIETIRECLTEQIHRDVYRPPLLKEHNPDLGTFGTVRDFRILDAESARSKGVNQKAPVEVYFGLDITDAAMACAYDEGSVVFTSPRLRGRVLGDKYAYADETGHEWPFFVNELSIVGTPHNKRQTPADGLRSVIMRDNSGGTPMDKVKQVAALLQQAAEMLLDGETEVEIETPMADGLGEVVEETVEEVVEEAAMEDGVIVEDEEEAVAMSDRVRRLERELARERASRVVDNAMRERTFTDASRDDLISIAMSDRKTFDLLTRQAPKRPAASSRVARPGTGKVVKGSAEHAGRVVAMMDKYRGPDGKIPASKHSALMADMRAARQRGEA